ncbi:MAG: 2-oxoacid:acceptor oxidoreductase subunit alpha [Dehalococcoidia bacterium]|nr:2-oxoacid:acceptor oxidoreductase subunit alpha [Dehalococcoidia bacterium]MDH4299437.1 2-oxoacid:acceptor oxidoreductase subunit alpha [Dehalococcoidia bacterium]MDH4366620.1 2-oxoacid:acceptor oxidoreductase subunit alpha [Dehalococcoidia bacterium]
MPIDFNFMVGGEAGQGVQSVGFLLAKVFARGGYHIFADQDYESRIRGGHNFFRVRVSDHKVNAIAEDVDILIAFNMASIELHQPKMVTQGIIIFDGEKIKGVSGNNGSLVSVPLEKLAEEKAGDKLMLNTVALGAALAAVNYDLDMLNTVLTDHFGKGEVGDKNIAAAKAGYDYVRSEHNGNLRKIKPLSEPKRMLLTGNEAISLGAIAAGCKFMAAYPMTPASSIMEYMAAKSKEFDLVMVHAEDEIAAINMAIGAAYAGVRAMTATSGSGLCLMVEGIGLAGITETPIVIIDGQRPGPAVGLPTRTEQGDLQFVLHAHHGDFPRAILAPATIEDAFWATVKAFNWADRYQLPVIVLTDQHLASSHATVDPIDLSKVTIDRGMLFSEKEDDPSEYMRHRVTKSGISPRAFPGLGQALVVTDCDEHDEEGHLTEDAGERTAQVQKRLRKILPLKKEIGKPHKYGSRGAETTLIGWGSTYGAIHEAVDMLRREDVRINMLHLSELWPFPAKAVADAVSKTPNTYAIENNATGQLARLIKAETGYDVSHRILKYDGRPFTPAYIAQAVKKEGC